MTPDCTTAFARDGLKV